MRKLRENTHIKLLSSRLSSKDIVDRLSAAKDNAPTPLEPYEILLCLVLLSLKGDGMALKEAAKIDLKVRWYKDILNILMHQGVSFDRNVITPGKLIDVPTQKSSWIGLSPNSISVGN